MRDSYLCLIIRNNYLCTIMQSLMSTLFIQPHLRGLLHFQNGRQVKTPMNKAAKILIIIICAQLCTIMRNNYMCTIMRNDYLCTIMRNNYLCTIIRNNYLCTIMQSLMSTLFIQPHPWGLLHFQNGRRVKTPMSKAAKILQESSRSNGI